MTHPGIWALALAAATVLPVAEEPDDPGSVPPPWTPMEVRDGSLLCWGREYEIQGVLPRQLASQGEGLLVAPVDFRIKGEPSPAWNRGPLSSRPRVVAWEASSSRDGAAWAARARVEYDGFWQVDVDLGKGEYKGLALEIPLASRHGRYLHFVNENHYQEPNTLALADRDGELWAGRFACMAWVGDEDVGLAWCSDSDAPFRLSRADRALTLRRHGPVTTLRVTLIDHPVRLEQPLRWRFGLVATPVRPMPRGWRNWRLAPGAAANHHILWWNAWAGSHADPEPKDATALTRQAREVRDKGQYLLPYVAMLALSERSAAYRDGGSRWRREPFSNLKDEGTPYWIMCPNTPWRGYFPDRMARLVRDHGLNGLYYDFTYPYRCDAAHHPCGYVDANGVRRGEFGVFATRRLAKATYERVKAERPDARILMHASGAMMYPYIGFADLMLDGEQLRQPLVRAEGRYFEVLPLEVLRAEYRGHHAGLAPFVIPELASPEGLPDPKLTAVPGPTQELLSLTLLHDLGVWPIYCHLQSVEAVRRAQADFGTAEAQFVPYWEGGRPVGVTDERLLVSCWVRSGGLLVAVVNRGDSRVEAQLRWQNAPGRLKEATDALTAGALAVDQETARLSVPSRGFRLLRLSVGD